MQQDENPENNGLAQEEEANKNEDENGDDGDDGDVVIDADLNGNSVHGTSDDENMSVVSDVVTEDDLVINMIGDDDKDNESTNSMSPEVAIEAKKISESSHAAASSAVLKENDDIDFEATTLTLKRHSTCSARYFPLSLHSKAKNHKP